MATLLEQCDRLGLHAGQVLRVHAAPPEIRMFEILLRCVAEPVPDVLADKGRREVAACLEAVDHRRGAGQEVNEALLRRPQGFSKLLALCDVAPGADHFDRIARPGCGSPAVRR